MAPMSERRTMSLLSIFRKMELQFNLESCRSQSMRSKRFSRSMRSNRSLMEMRDNASGPGGSHKGTVLLTLGVAAVAGVAIAASFVPQRRVETSDHPLKRSLNRRINLFSNLARHASDPAARPPRRAGDEGEYVNADDSIV